MLTLSRAVAIGGLLVGASAHAQVVTQRYADEPTGGVALPGTPLAGDFDARALVVNPGGLAFVDVADVTAALHLDDTSYASSSGAGFGAYAVRNLAGGVLPPLSVGLGVEWLRPPRANLDPDPGQPFRFTFGAGLRLGHDAAVGMTWHHFSADGALDGVNAFDAGAAWRLDNHFAVGAVVRDLATRAIAGTPVQRRYELEALGRPFGSSVLEVAAGGRVGETRGDLDGWGRLVVRATPGFAVVGHVESRALHALEDSPMGVRDVGGRELRATFGIDVSFGAFGVAALGSELRDRTGTNHVLGGTFVAHVASVPAPAVLGTSDHIERVELTGDIDLRALTAIVRRLRAIASDRSARGVVVVFDGVGGGWATLDELRDELVALRRRGKKVFAYMASGTGRDYFIASACDKIYIDPAGGLRIVGIAGTTLFFRGLFDRVGVTPQFEKIAEYKSAPEQFTDTGPSAAAAEMHRDLYDDLYAHWVDTVAAGRHLAPDRVKALVDAGPYTAGDLQNNRELIDGIGTPEKIAEWIGREVGGNYPVAQPGPTRRSRWHNPTVAVVYIEGDIVDGASRSIPLIGEKVAGGQTIVAAIEAARSDPNVDAIVLRIDSPGGSAVASELISREVFATRGVKPIVCSMSNLAASGGYFVAAGCDRIFAEPATITGSIGIFYGKFDLSGLLRNVGVTTATEARGKHADAESLFRPYTDEERTALQAKLRYMYGRFVGAVAEGRALSHDAVDRAGRGHVYAGVRAEPLHLIDAFGGLSAALDEVRRKLSLAADAELDFDEVPAVPPGLLGAITSLFGGGGGRVSDGALPAFARELLRAIPASLLADPTAAQARLPDAITFE